MFFSIMLKYILLCSVLACEVAVLGFFSKGKWLIDMTEKCPEDEKYSYNVDIRKSTYNKTHDEYYIEFELLEDLTEEDFGFVIETCQKTSDTCKLINRYEVASFCKFMTEKAKKRFEEAMEDMPDCPIEKGSYKFESYLLDTRNMLKDGISGSFISTFWLTDPTFETELACTRTHSTFIDKNDLPEEEVE